MTNKEIKLNLSGKIHALMIKHNISNSELAKKTNKQASVIYKWLSGSHNFTMKTLCEIAFVFSIDVRELFMPDVKQVDDKLTVDNPVIFIIPAGCEIGCKTFSGGEKKHVKGCVHYPESQSELMDNLTTENAILKEEINLRNEYYESKIDTLNRINDSNYAENARLREAFTIMQAMILRNISVDPIMTDLLIAMKDAQPKP